MSVHQTVFSTLYLKALKHVDCVQTARGSQFMHCPLPRQLRAAFCKLRITPGSALRLNSVCRLPPTLLQLPDTVRQTYERGQQLAAEKDAEGVVCVPASAVKEGMLPEGAGKSGAGPGAGKGAGKTGAGAGAGKSSGACERGSLGYGLLLLADLRVQRLLPESHALPQLAIPWLHAEHSTLLGWVLNGILGRHISRSPPLQPPRT